MNDTFGIDAITPRWGLDGWMGRHPGPLGRAEELRTFGAETTGPDSYYGKFGGPKALNCRGCNYAGELCRSRTKNGANSL
jgi:hypothetical protein